jgi:hypothetical protein
MPNPPVVQTVEAWSRVGAMAPRELWERAEAVLRRRDAPSAREVSQRVQMAWLGQTLWGLNARPSPTTLERPPATNAAAPHRQRDARTLCCTPDSLAPCVPWLGLGVIILCAGAVVAKARTRQLKLQSFERLLACAVVLGVGYGVLVAAITLYLSLVSK